MAYTLDSWLAEWKRAKQSRPRLASLDRISGAAFETFQAHGFPTTREEDWRFTSVAPIADNSFALVMEPRTAGLDIARLRLPGDVATELVFVDGRYVAGLSRLPALPAGSRAESLAAAIASPHEQIQTHLTRVASFDRGPFLAALARGLIVIAKGDLYAIADQRWYRLTRTYGGVVAAFLPAQAHGHVLAFVTRGKTSHKLGVGSVDLATGLTTRAQPLAPVATQLAATKDGGIWVGQQGQKPRVLTLSPGEQQGTLVATKLARPSGAWLEVYASGGVRLHRVPDGVSADWDDQGLASAIRIAASNRVVTVPGQIAGDSIVWSPDRNHLALVAQTSDHCDAATPSVTAYAIDTATGAASEVARGHGLAIDWVGDRAVAIAGDEGVNVRELGGATTPLVGATNLVHPRFAPKCEALPTEAPAESDDEPAEN